MNTFTFTPDELKMLVEAIHSYEDGYNFGKEEDKVYYGKLLALADRFRAELGWPPSKKPTE